MYRSKRERRAQGARKQRGGYTTPNGRQEGARTSIAGLPNRAPEAHQSTRTRGARGTRKPRGGLNTHSSPQEEGKTTTLGQSFSTSLVSAQTSPEDKPIDENARCAENKEYGYQSTRKPKGGRIKRRRALRKREKQPTWVNPSVPRKSPSKGALPGAPIDKNARCAKRKRERHEFH